jgi:hypothetical protein
MKQCKQCERQLPQTAFLALSRKYRVTICNDCANENMARWARTHMVGKKASEFKEAPDAR